MFRFCSVWFRVFSVETPFQPQNTPNKKGTRNSRNEDTKKRFSDILWRDIRPQTLFENFDLCFFGLFGVGNPKSEIPNSVGTVGQVGQELNPLFSI